jgi:hypothetical protein
MCYIVDIKYCISSIELVIQKGLRHAIYNEPEIDPDFEEPG